MEKTKLLKKKTIVLICCRAGSKGIKNKNLKKFGNTTLLGHTINFAKKNKFTSIFVSTDSAKIANYARKNGAKIPFIRPKNLAKDETSELDVWKHFANFVKKNFSKKPQIILVLPVTAPLRSIRDINEAYKKISKNKKQLIFSASKSIKSPYFNIIIRKNNKIQTAAKVKKTYFTRQSAPVCFDVTTVLYLIKFEHIFKMKNIFHQSDFIEIPPERSIDIDTELDYEIAKFMLAHYK